MAVSVMRGTSIWRATIYRTPVTISFLWIFWQIRGRRRPVVSFHEDGIASTAVNSINKYIFDIVNARVRLVKYVLQAIGCHSAN